MRGTGQSAFTHAKLHIKARKTLGEAPKTAAEGKSLKLVKEFLLNMRLFFAESNISTNLGEHLRGDAETLGFACYHRETRTRIA